jgi:hypothetical protein
VIPFDFFKQKNGYQSGDGKKNHTTMANGIPTTMPMKALRKREPTPTLIAAPATPTIVKADVSLGVARRATVNKKAAEQNVVTATNSRAIEN